MKPKLIVILLLIVLVPLGLIAWLGVRTARAEQEQVQQRLNKALTARLVDVRENIVLLAARHERELLRLTELPAIDPAIIRDIVRNQRLVRQMFVIAPNRTFIFPPPGGSSDREREDMERLVPVMKNGPAFLKAGAETGADAGQSGWHTWFADEGIRFIFWRRLAGGRTAGVEVESAALMADVIALMPASGARGGDLPAGRIVLLDARNYPLYQWGDYSPGERALPAARLTLAPPLNAWSLEYYLPPAPGAGRILSGSALFNVGAATGVVALALIALGVYFYRESSREIREASRKVSFVNQVSHELKTPLTNIRMYAELLEERLPADDGKARDHLGVIIAESRRLSRLINNVLTLARPGRARPTLHPVAGVIDGTITSTLEGFRPVFEEAGVRIVFTPGAGRQVRYDADVLEQILGNLFSNVEKYAVAGGLLEVTSSQEGDRTEIVVADRGPGIPPDQADNIFRPFVRLSNRLTDGVAGTGIGLTIARDLARLHGGDIILEPSAAGARFKVELHTPVHVA